jgi:hypothetical protein
MKPTTKIFGIGYQRTGTTSLAAALNHLGIKTRQFPKELWDDLDDPIIDQFQGFTDDPVTLLWRKLDERWPDAKFVHTIRSDESWLKSIEWLMTTGQVKFKESFDAYGNTFNMELFGTTEFEPELFLAKYRAYNEDVITYFADRPDDYLQIDVTKGEGFEKLCPFLGLPVPAETAFPRLNVQENILKVRLRRLKQALKRRLGR